MKLSHGLMFNINLLSFKYYTYICQLSDCFVHELELAVVCCMFMFLIDHSSAQLDGKHANFMSTNNDQYI